MTWQTILSIASGGAIGAILRAYANLFINSKFASQIPYSTVFVNLMGSLLMGILFALFYKHQITDSYLKSFLVAGFLGAFTTYSTFAIESVFLLDSDIKMAFLYIGLNLIGSILFAFFGFKIILSWIN